ncbi:MAG: class I SAM-dependent methyltransferase [Actinobacteria bacterium]|nr:class I SAM-dependent methyltransferase [Actinomycetota bacterium]
MDPAPQVDVEALVDELRARVQERRRQGQYPARLEEDLDAHFQRIVAHRPRTYDLDRLRRLIDGLEERIAFDPNQIPIASKVPGGTALHRFVAKAVRRQVQGVLEQVSAYTRSLQEVLQEVMQVLEAPDAHEHPQLTGRVDTVVERLGQYERGPADSDMLHLHVLHRLHELEQAEARRSFRPWFASQRLAHAVGDAPEHRQARHRELAEQFDGFEPVVDLGCRTGEFVRLLQERGIEAAGVEPDPELAAAAQRLGLAVRQAHPAAGLAAAADASLGGAALLQVLEHVGPQEVVELVALAARKVRPGGKVVVETVNPQSLYVFAHGFYLDPTHTAPVHPAYLRFLFEEAGYRSVEIHWRSPVPDGDALVEKPEGTDDAAAWNEQVSRLNRLLFAPQDYALVAIR